MARREVELLSARCKCGTPSMISGAAGEPLRCVTCGDALEFPEQEQSAPESVLSEAARLVDGDRQTAYGHPKDNHACTAELWNAYLERRAEAVLPERGFRHPWPLDAFDVCMLNILQKVSRLAHTRQRDGLVDIAGFARNAEMVDE